MCGILGFTSKDEPLLRRGLQTLAHRGPDAVGVFVSDDLSLGHRRLAIIDRREEANQPMRRDEALISFNGEIYNFRELRRDLERLGHEFTTASDTEVLLVGYRAYGLDVFTKLRGMWAIALYDAKTGHLILARDSFGIKPLYYSVVGSRLAFSSEIKALLPLLPTIRPNAPAYAQFFPLGYVLAPDTVFEGVQKLLPGEVLVWSLADRSILSRRSILSPLAPADDDRCSFGEAALLVDRALHESVEAHFLADVPVALLLSGGNDSSLLAAVSKDLGKSPSLFHLQVHGSADTYYARRVAQHLGLPLEVIVMDERAMEAQYEAVWASVDEPTADTSIVPTSLIYSAIKGRSKVVLSGEGGDELFGGYLRHRALARHDRVRPYPALSRFADIAMRGASPVALGTVTLLIGRARRWLSVHGVPNDVLSAYLDGTRVIGHPYRPAPLRQRLERLFATHPLGHSVPVALFYDLFAYLPNDLLYKNDIASMASSIEARVPFLDRALLTTVVTDVPGRYLLSRGYSGKALLKKIMESYLPSDLVYRDKRGFGYSPRKYAATGMRVDARHALAFHARHAALFGIPRSVAGLFDPRRQDFLLRKYPRFIFGLISNWRIWRDRF